MSRSLPVRGPRLWLLRGTALLLVPLAFIFVEAALRLLDVGYSTRFLIPTEDGTLISNRRFSERFFPPTLARPPVPFAIETPKDEQVFRIFVVGGSAARGTPEPAFGVARVLEAVLEESFPGRRFEVINAAITAINSHVALPIVHDIARVGEADLVIVYLGNNEVVGPWGAASVLGDFSSSRSMVRSGIALRGLRLGQLLDRLLAPQPPEGGWRGMAMFMEQRVAADDPRLESIYANFAANLEDMVEAARRGGAQIALSSVAVNLHQPPFASCATPPEAEEKVRLRLDKIRRQLRDDQGADNPGSTALEAALKVVDGILAEQPRHAGAYQLRGLVLESLSRPEQAREAFERARDLDALRFRADSRINDEIRAVAKRLEVPLVDAAEAFAATPALQRAFLEHVHLRFDGNFALANLLREVVARSLKIESPAPAGPVAVARRLAFTLEDALAIEADILDLIRRPPFGGRHNMESGDLPQRHAQIQHLRRLADAPSGRAETERLYLQRLEAKPQDLMARLRWAKILEGWGQSKRALEHWQDLIAALPENLAWRRAYAVALAKSGDPAAAVTMLEQAAQRASESRIAAQIHIDLGGIHESSRRLGWAAEQYRRAQELDPDNPLPPFNLAMLAAQRGEIELAITGFQDLAQRHPDFAQALQNLGVAYEKSGDMAAAEQTFRREIAARPDAAGGYFRLGRLLISQGRVEAALEHFEQAILRQPDHAPSYFKIADLILERDAAKAAAFYQQGLVYRPRNKNARQNLARAMSQLDGPSPGLHEQ